MVNWGVGRRIAPISQQWSTVVTWDMFKTLEDLMKYRVGEGPNPPSSKSKMRSYNPDGFRNQIIFQPLKFAVKQKKRIVIGTTGFSKKEENLIKNFSKKIPILKAGNMSLGVNLLMYLTEIASKSLGNNFLSKVYEVHHKHKIDYPSGTALMLGRGIADGKNKNFYNLIGKKYLNKKSFPYGKKINFNSIRKGKTVGEHEVKFSSGKEIITLNHEAFDRALYSEGALTAGKWLMNKKPGLYSMRDVLNFK